MIEYVDDAGAVTMGTNFGESYDKEWALKDQGRREEKRELALKFFDEGVDLKIISSVT